MEPLAPIVDRMRDIANEVLPTPRSCKVRLWDDGTFDVVIYHSMGGAGRQTVRYERATGEIVHEHIVLAGTKAEAHSDGEPAYTPDFDVYDVRVIERIDPPYE